MNNKFDSTHLGMISSLICLVVFVILVIILKS